MLCRHIHLRLFYGSWAEPTCGSDWFEVLLWAETRFDWLGHVGLQFYCWSPFKRPVSFCCSAPSNSLSYAVCRRCSLLWGYLHWSLIHDIIFQLFTAWFLCGVIVKTCSSIITDHSLLTLWCDFMCGNAMWHVCMSYLAYIFDVLKFVQAVFNILFT